MTDYLRYCIQKAERYLNDAEAILKTQYPAGAVTSSYYAFFWLVRGLLQEKGIITKRHSGAREMFALHYVKTGEISASFYNDFDDLYDQRQIADYDLDGDFDQQQVVELKALAEVFLKFVKENYG